MKDFRIRILIRVVLLGAALALFVFMLSNPNMVFAAVLNFFILIIQLFELYRFTTQTNRKLTRFLESVRYSDFVSGFTADNKLGKSFKDLNEAFNEVFEAFRKARSEKEENWQYLNTIVQQVRTGIISFDAEGNVQLMNANAKRFMDEAHLKNIHDLSAKNKKLYLALMEVESGKSTLYKTNDFLLTLQATELRIRGSLIKLVTLQNIQTELQRQELEAWQNLTRVLRHEIMNSITPISSLTSTLREILDHEMIKKENTYELKTEAAEDLKEGLNTIENRSKGLIKFIDAYREYTSLPQPNIKTVLLKKLIDHTAQLMKQELKKTTIQFSTSCDSEYLTIQADAEMIEQVLINLLKNAMESLAQTENGKIELSGKYNGTNIIIEVIDNGPGIIPEAINRIFVPFFTTKKTGSGIGLALSRQIMQMHNGSLTVESEPEVKTVFTLKF
ncbi:MAG: Sensor histidine kinase involved in nitrogen fixation and metabolism regulation [Cytophagales bacterium]|nr:GHKL domain-containing protein [Bacteroidota bacterium]MBS1980919.1 GHKL domain-containing protein [Bacteroidota bacterium]WHZ08271.1 MAG: Sensor histidine kinase involved in nitrogen fixation and metabolism regulation [Cytophagales bacterium]